MKLLAAAVASASMTVSAQQVINNEGTGQVLLYPFYSVESGSNTYIHVANTTGASKAVKIRFSEGRNGQVALEFNAYLGPYDVFPMAVGSVEGGGAVLTNDGTCTAPELGTANGDYSGSQSVLADGSVLMTQPFVPYLYTDDVSSSIGRTQLGFVEVIEMGEVDSSIDVSKCSDVRKLWASGAWSTDSSTNVTAPAGGLAGTAMFINPSLAYSVSIDVTAIDGWAKPLTNYHTGPGTLGTNLDEGVKKATIWDGEEYVTVDYTSQSMGSAMATGALLSARQFSNEVQIESGLAAETDFVVTQPLAKFYTSSTTATAPYTKAYDATKAANVACESFKLTQFDRASGSSVGAGTFVPATSNGTAGDLCDAVSVIKFDTNSALLVDGAVPVGFQFQNGQARFVSENSFVADDNGVTVQGLPVIGFAATRIVNGPMSYGYSAPHASLTVTSGT